jgi:hypothetical protein
VVQQRPDPDGVARADRSGGRRALVAQRLSDALHLAAADRLPRPLAFVTFDPGQIPVAMALGFDVIST